MKGYKWMERGHCGVDKTMAMQEVDEQLESFLEGGIGKSRWLLGFHRGYEGAGGIQVAPRPHEGVADRKSLFVGEDHELGCQKPVRQAGAAAVERGVGLGGDKSGRS